jgi:hypothetical protein
MRSSAGVLWGTKQWHRSPDASRSVMTPSPADARLRAFSALAGSKSAQQKLAHLGGLLGRLARRERQHEPCRHEPAADEHEQKPCRVTLQHQRCWQTFYTSEP